MDLSSLEIACTVAAESSVTRAARLLGRAPSNVTIRIQQLERQLGVALFSRDGKRMSLTREGGTFLGYAKRLLALAQEARDAVKPLVPEGSLRVGSMESAAASRLPEALARFHVRWPAVSISLAIGASRELLMIRDLAGRVLRISPEWSALFGFSTPRLQGTPLLSLIHPQDVWATHDVMDRVNFTKMVSGYVNRYRALDGIYRPLVWTARMFQDRVVGVAHEIPAR